MSAQARLLISAISSGAGKTTLSLGIMAVLQKRGMRIQPFKVGPDYIDGKYHELVTGRKSYNLDGWMLDKRYVIKRFCEESTDCDISIIEGVMGLYDGLSGITDEGSSAQIAKWLACPVILIVDASSMARSVAAVVKGVELFDKDINLAGVIFNRVGSSRHVFLLRQAVENNCDTTVLGAIPRNTDMTIPSRHLGLVTHAQEVVTKGFLDTLTTAIECYVDVDLLQKKASSTAEVLVAPDTGCSLVSPRNQTSSCRVAVAYDEAFCFYYYDNFRIMEEMGITVVFFSPVDDSCLPKDIDGIYIGGGYPELFADRLEANGSLREEIHDFIEAGGVVYAECGGLIYLSQKVTTIESKEYAMVGSLPCTARMLKKRKMLGYVSVEVLDDCLAGKKGDVLRGHEYHYSSIDDMPDSIEKVYGIRKRGVSEERREGYRYKNLLASYVHMHFGMNDAFAQGFIRNYSAG